MARRFRSFAARSVVPLPMNGSRTVVPGAATKDDSTPVAEGDDLDVLRKQMADMQKKLDELSK